MASFVVCEVFVRLVVFCGVRLCIPVFVCLGPLLCVSARLLCVLCVFVRFFFRGL